MEARAASRAGEAPLAPPPSRAPSTSNAPIGADAHESHDARPALLAGHVVLPLTERTVPTPRTIARSLFVWIGIAVITSSYFPVVVVLSTVAWLFGDKTWSL